MTGFLRGKAVSQVDAILGVDGKVFTEKQIMDVLKDVEPYPVKTSKKK